MAVSPTARVRKSPRLIRTGTLTEVPSCNGSVAKDLFTSAQTSTVEKGKKRKTSLPKVSRNGPKGCPSALVKSEQDVSGKNAVEKEAPSVEASMKKLREESQQKAVDVSDQKSKEGKESNIDRGKRKSENSSSGTDGVLKRTKSPGVRVIHGRIYDSENGKTCHQCRQKTIEVMATCKNSGDKRPCKRHFCMKCLFNRYGEKVEEVCKLEQWHCPVCRGICNCSICMKKQGCSPTGILARAAKATGFASVADLLKSGINNENVKELSVPALTAFLESIRSGNVGAKDIVKKLKAAQESNDDTENIPSKENEDEGSAASRKGISLSLPSAGTVDKNTKGKPSDAYQANSLAVSTRKCPNKREKGKEVSKNENERGDESSKRIYDVKKEPSFQREKSKDLVVDDSEDEFQTASAPEKEKSDKLKSATALLVCEKPVQDEQNNCGPKSDKKRHTKKRRVNDGDLNVDNDMFCDSKSDETTTASERKRFNKIILISTASTDLKKALDGQNNGQAQTGKRTYKKKMEGKDSSEILSVCHSEAEFKKTSCTRQNGNSEEIKRNTNEKISKDICKNENSSKVNTKTTKKRKRDTSTISTNDGGDTSLSVADVTMKAENHASLNKSKKKAREDCKLEDIALPQGEPLLSTAGIEFSSEEVGMALQFLEFCSAFAEVLDMKKGQPESILKEITRGRIGRNGIYSSVVQFHVKLLSLIGKDNGEWPEISHLGNVPHSWVQFLKTVAAKKSHFIKEECLPLCPNISPEEQQKMREQIYDVYDSLEAHLKGGYEGYAMLSNTAKLRLLNMLCDECLNTVTLRTWIDAQNEKRAASLKEKRGEIMTAKEKAKDAKQKMRDEIARMLVSRSGGSITIEEHDQLLSRVKLETEKAAAANEDLEKASSQMKEPVCDALRTERIAFDKEGRAYWRLKGGSGRCIILRQEIANLDPLLGQDGWYSYNEQEEKKLTKYVALLRTARRQRNDGSPEKGNISTETDPPSNSEVHAAATTEANSAGKDMHDG